MLQNTKKAFTLAEAVITLIFLSIIAAHIISSVNTTRPSSEKVLFKKAYSTVENTVSNLINDDRLYPVSYQQLTFNNLTQECQKGFLETTTGTLDDVNTKSTFIAYNDLVSNSKCNAGTKLVRLFCASLNTTKANCSDYSCEFTTTDGMSWEIEENSSPASYSPVACHSLSGLFPMLNIKVDVNGPAEPNASEGVNIPDIYYMNVYYNGKVEVDKTRSPKGIVFLKNPTNNKRRSDIEDDRFGED